MRLDGIAVAAVVTEIVVVAPAISMSRYRLDNMCNRRVCIGGFREVSSQISERLFDHVGRYFNTAAFRDDFLESAGLVTIAVILHDLPNQP